MNSKRRIVVVSAIAIVGLGLTTGWNVLAADTWPPEPYQVLSWAGAWTFTDPTGNLATVLVSPPDLRTGTGFGLVTWIIMDPTLNGLFPQATSMSQGFNSYVTTGPDTCHVHGITYVLKDTKPKATILGLVVGDGTSTRTSPDAGRHEGTLSVYSAAADKDGDGLPDPGVQPLVSFPIAGPMERI